MDAQQARQLARAGVSEDEGGGARASFFKTRGKDGLAQPPPPQPRRPPECKKSVEELDQSRKLP